MGMRQAASMLVMEGALAVLAPAVTHGFGGGGWRGLAAIFSSLLVTTESSY